LARPAREITLLDIVAAVDAAPEPTVLPAVRAKYRGSMAAINRLCKQSADQFTKSLDKVPLTRLMQIKSAAGAPGKSAARRARVKR
jgi:DNA-binding IscR family transcriptional regulator